MAARIGLRVGVTERGDLVVLSDLEMGNEKPQVIAIDS